MPIVESKTEPAVRFGIFMVMKI